jgi:acetyl esterase/lipase
VIQHLVNKGFDYNNIIILGRSIGSGPAIFAAAHHKVAALVLISPFLSICKLVADKYGLVCSFLI